MSSWNISVVWKGIDLELAFLLFLRTDRPAPGSFCLVGSKPKTARPAFLMRWRR